jgi:hypothetical protein
MRNYDRIGVSQQVARRLRVARGGTGARIFVFNPGTGWLFQRFCVRDLNIRSVWVRENGTRDVLEARGQCKPVSSCASATDASFTAVQQ